jgi:hypothetical protein
MGQSKAASKPWADWRRLQRRKSPGRLTFKPHKRSVTHAHALAANLASENICD